jgi:hypothetical protein
MNAELAEVAHLKESLFADDTALYDQIAQAGYEEVAGLLEKREAEGKDGGEQKTIATTQLLDVYHEIVARAGTRENLDKREIGLVHEIAVRFLGLNTDPETDTRNKTNAAWKAFHALSAKIAGVQGMSRKVRGQLLMTVVRATLIFGAQSRPLPPRQLNALVKEENSMLATFMSYPNWKTRGSGVSFSPFRFQLRVPSLRAEVNYLRARFYGHVMRGEEGCWARRALTGRFIPETDESAGEAELTEKERAFLDRTKILGGDQADGVQTITESVVAWLEKSAGVPQLAIPHLLGRDAATKFKFSTIIREGYARDVREDWEKGAENASKAELRSSRKVPTSRSI